MWAHPKFHQEIVAADANNDFQIMKLVEQTMYPLEQGKKANLVIKGCQEAQQTMIIHWKEGTRDRVVHLIETKFIRKLSTYSCASEVWQHPGVCGHSISMFLFVFVLFLGGLTMYFILRSVSSKKTKRSL